MNNATIALAGAQLDLLPSGALWWPNYRLLAVGDLHLGKAERIARRQGSMLPPYESQDTLARLDDAIRMTEPRTIVSLGDAFDDLGAARALPDDVHEMICRMAAGRQWIWIAGNHDPGPVNLPGTSRAELTVAGLTFRHIAAPGASAEISAHYHPKMRITLRRQQIARRCFLSGNGRLILPAFGTYTGGMDPSSPVLTALLGPEAIAFLLGRRITVLPVHLAA